MAVLTCALTISDHEPFIGNTRGPKTPLSSSGCRQRSAQPPLPKTGSAELPTRESKALSLRFGSASPRWADAIPPRHHDDGGDGHRQGTLNHPPLRFFP